MEMHGGKRVIRVSPADRWILSADIGQSQDPAALALMHHVRTPLDAFDTNTIANCYRQKASERYDVLALGRIKLGTKYTDQVNIVKTRLIWLHEKGIRPTFCLDFTGCGRPVGDMFDAVGLSPTKILITAGNTATQHEGTSAHDYLVLACAQAVSLANNMPYVHSEPLRI